MSMTRPFLPLPPPAISGEPAPSPAQAREEGPKILFIPLAEINTTKLQRDRSCHIDPQIDDLKASILATGLSNPIRVDISRPGRVELVQGWRRLSAYRALFAETDLTCFAEIPAIAVENFTSNAKLYRRMVDENMVRKDLSWAEMGRIALIYKYENASDCSDLEEAIDILFASASPQKRNYIRHFAELIHRLEKVRAFPEAIPRALGIALNQALKSESGRTAMLCSALRANPQRDLATELDILRHFATEPEAPDRFEDSPLVPRGLYTPAKRKARTPQHDEALVRLDLMGGNVTCTFATGRVELHLDRDFTQIPRNRLEAAVAAFCAALVG